MRPGLSSGSIVETAVTLAVAVLMTVAGVEMLDGTAELRASGNAVAHVSVRVAAFDDAAVMRIALPHVDEFIA